MVAVLSNPDLLTASNIDPHFIPRVPMRADTIDAGLLTKLAAKSMKHGKEITAETHPEFYAAWVELSKRAGLVPPPQLILAESNVVNALTMTKQEVVITTGMIRTLNMRELTAVLGHELGHVTSKRKFPDLDNLKLLSVPLAVAGGIFAYSGGFAQLLKSDAANANALQKAANWLVEKRNPLMTALGCILYAAAGAAIGTGMAIAGKIAVKQVLVRPSELEADHNGALISGDPEGLISALGKLEAARSPRPIDNYIKWLKSGYPSAQHRIEKLRQLEQTMPLMARAADNTVEIPPIVPQPPFATNENTRQVSKQEAKAANKNVPQLQVSQVAAAARIGAVAEAALANG